MGHLFSETNTTVFSISVKFFHINRLTMLDCGTLFKSQNSINSYILGSV